MGSHYINHVILFVLTTLIISPAISLASCKFPAIFNFGDSNSDTGGLSAAFGQAPPPNGETYFHAPAGRYSDGRLMIDFIAESLGLPCLNAYLDSVVQTLAMEPILPLLDQPSDHRTQPYSKYIYAHGGRTFWIHNTGPVGCLPFILDLFPVTAAQVDKYGCASPYNEVAQYFNRRLKEVVVQLRKDLPMAAFTYVDVYSVKYTLITQAKKFGFEHPLVACCGHGGKYNYNKNFKCGGKVMVRGKEMVIANSCKDPSVRINWDGIHFTEAANKWIFEQIANGSFSNPPTPRKMACNGVNK